MKTVRPLRALGKVLLTTVLTVATIAAALHFSGAVDMSHVAVKVKDKVEVRPFWTHDFGQAYTDAHWLYLRVKDAAAAPA